MATSSSSRIKRYHVFPSFHGPDVRRGFLSHLHHQFTSKGITTFKDQEIKRGHTIGPELVQAIRESRVLIVLLSENYASSTWCLEELVEILKCQEEEGHTVMTIFYDVNPSDVRKQSGNFGSVFKRTCEDKTEEEKQRWRKALAYVATIAGEHSLNWTDEAGMVEKFATDVSNKLNVTLSRDFDDMVGLQTHLRKLSTLLCFECDDVKMIGMWGPAGIGKKEEEKQRWRKALTYVATIAGEHSLNWTDEAGMVEKFATDVSNKLNVTLSMDFDDMVGLQTHLRKLSTLLCFECDDVKMIGMWGPAGIGKSTIARALFNHLSSEFRLRCFMGNLKGGIKSIMGVDDYDSKLGLQNNLLSKLLSQRDIRVHHLGSIKEWLQDQRVLIILDDVDDLDLLEVLANEPSWFGFGSRIIVTTEDKKILKAHGIQDIYHVDFPSSQEAIEILCLSAFKQNYVRDGFEEVANRVAYLCGNLPLGLAVVGSSLRGESKQEWELQLCRIESNLDRKIEDVLRVGYDRLSRKDQSLFLHIACIFNNYDEVDYVKSMVADSNLDVENGLKTLAVKSLVQIQTEYSPKHIEMNSLLQQLGRQVVHEQSDEPGKRQFLVEAEEIRDVLTKETGTGSVIGISLDMIKTREFSISGRAFEGMPNLRFLRICTSYTRCGISEDMEYLPRLKLLSWHSYPRKRLPPSFQPECLVELHMPKSKLGKLWGGIQPLANLKKIDLEYSSELKQIPNLSKATNLERLRLVGCTSLVELPSSIRNLQKLVDLSMTGCVKLRVIPTNINLASLETVQMNGCSRLKTFPEISNNIRCLDVENTKIEDAPASIAESWLHLQFLSIGSKSLKRLTHVPKHVTNLNLSDSDIKKIPDCVIGLPHLDRLIIRNCRKLVSLQGLRRSLRNLDAADCGSLKSVCFSFYEPKAYITLDNCKCVKSEKDAIRVSSSFYNPIRQVNLTNCLKLDEEARRVIIQRWVYRSVWLPGKEVPAEFTYKAKGNSITISEGTFSASSRFKVCLLLPPTKKALYTQIGCRIRSKGVLINELDYYHWEESFLTEHLLVFSGVLFKEHRCHELDTTTSEINFEFNCNSDNSQIIDGMIIECGVQILAEKGEIKITSSFNDPNREVRFLNYLSLDEEARRAIIQQWAYRYVCLPGKYVPAEFTHRATGNSVTISQRTLSASSNFKACILLSPNLEPPPFFGYNIICRLRRKGVLINELNIYSHRQLLTEHLFVFHGAFYKEQRCVGVEATTSEILFEFSCSENADKIVECGVQILTEEGESNSSKWKEQSDGTVEVSKYETVIKSSKYTGWWSWLKKLDLSKKEKNINKE